MITCAIDQTSHESIDALHGHLKTLRVARERYWHTHAPRRDRLTGELIPFKDYEQYVSQDFLDKINLKRWLKEQPRAVGLEWAKSWLNQRRAGKGLVYAPSQVELRTLCCPSMPYYQSVGAEEGGYYGITKALGFTARYSPDPLCFVPLPSGATIIQDTREQTPVKLTLPTIKATLNVGDYALAPPYDLGIRIERKSLGDFCGTLSTRSILDEDGFPTGQNALKRFDAELARAVAAGLYVVMMVEANINDAQRFNFLPQTKWVKASPAFIFHNLRELLIKYPLTFQVLFVDGRREMADKIKRVFELGNQVKTTDLQFALEEGLL